ncbi:hypothetical protein [Paenibacillus cucumis (ex Kampfer et al. 2016)]|uniref:Spore coat protein n=1 Tax=Paenibacillus cucumis (ex Kampfer et al. 2016) TaxID=1776858 RepID=A0ABS7KFT5_9BACL|nr:hypothetical protein [Paenibacillus cucumis (ex Kampfer et al. 2016)]MBY0202797.1 hypothetical protein [Paenibacillus cucumis (ex Kampfer et al. 2016)]
MKLLMWFVKMVLIVLLVSSLTLLTTGLIVQSYAKSLLASFNIQWEGQPMGLMGMFQGALGDKQSSEGEKSEDPSTDQRAGTKEEKAPENSISVMGNGTTNSGTSSNDETGGAGASGDSGNGTVDGNGTAAERDTSSGQEANSNHAKGNDAIVVTPDDITGAKNKLPTEEKERIFTLLMNKLPQKEMQQISGAMEGGLTEQELREIEQVISKYLTSEEYDDLMQVLQAE